MGTGGPFPGGKARPGRDADHSPPSSAEVENVLELYLLSPQAPPWRVAGLLYLFFYLFRHLRLIYCVTQKLLSQVSVLATGPKGHGFKAGQVDEFLRAIKIHSTPSCGWEVKPGVPCRRILRHVKDPLAYQSY
jgi:hypothetical protein